MKICIDIGHPAHVHYFRNFMKLMGEKGHEFFITARDKEVIQYLLDYYQIPYYDRGKGASGMVGKFWYIFQADRKLWVQARKFKPDVFLSFASPYAAHVAWLTRKPHIVLDDTESALLNHMLYLPFSAVVLNPRSFRKKLGPKQLFFDSYMELSYLHPNYFTPDASVFQLLGLQPGARYAILRFVSWHANHDVGQRGLDYDTKLKLVKRLEQDMNVFISSEGELPPELKKYQIQLPPERLHDALAFAQIYIGEGATTASECAMLGTPAIYVNSLSAGTLEDQHDMGLLYNFRDASQLFPTLEKILAHSTPKEELTSKRTQLLQQKIDPTSFFDWFIENYPDSRRIMKENSGYQYRFK